MLCMNVDQHDVNWLVVPFLTMNKTSNMMLSLFEKGVLINDLALKLAVSYLKLKLAISSLRITLSALLYETTFLNC